MKEVYINRIAKFLPYDAIDNDHMEEVLGMINGQPSKVRRIILRSNGIKTRYYGLGEGKDVLNNTHITAEAVQRLFDHKEEMEKIELLSCGTTSPDQTLPSHAAMVHGKLGIGPVEISSFSGACNTGINALKYAYFAVASGDKNYAVSTGSERLSSALRAEKYQTEIDKVKEIEEDGYIAFEKDFLRWMLSDGAGAALLSDKPNENGVSLRIEWIEMISFAGDIETCMYSGAIKEGEDLIGYNDLETNEWLDQSVFALKQDTRLLGENIVPKGVDFIETVMKKRNFNPKDVDWFLPHLSSEFFRLKIHEELARRNIDIPLDVWFTNLAEVGNVGAASPYLMLEELMNNDQFKKGQKVFLMIPESARFSYSFILLTVV